MSTLHYPFGTQKIRMRNINENKKNKANGSRYAALIHFILLMAIQDPILTTEHLITIDGILKKVQDLTLQTRTNHSAPNKSHRALIQIYTPSNIILVDLQRILWALQKLGIQAHSLKRECFL